MASGRLGEQIRFIVEIDRLKTVVRQTSLVDRSRQENDAEHSWHIAVMALVLSEYSNHDDIDIYRVVKMLLVHDLVEIYAGDTFLYSEYDRDVKVNNERAAAAKLFRLLPADQAEEMMEAWEEFEAEETPEAMFAKTMDALQPVLLGYYNKGWSWHQHSIRKDEILKHKEHMKKGSETLWELVRELLREAEERGYVPE
ncbi:MAG: HD domain-containing protein [Candidatus Thorarchaeota archaeon]